VITVLAGVGPASAHLGTLSYSDVTVRGDAVGYRLKFAAHLVPGLERIAKPTRAHVVKAEPAMLDWLQRTVLVRIPEGPCAAVVDEMVGPDANDDLTVLLAFACPARVSSLRVEFHAFDVSLPDYRNIVSVRTETSSLAYVFTRETPVLTFGKASAGAWTRFREFFGLGVEHIATGYDHLLFLLALLLPGGTFLHIAGIVTAFTIAHSITLGLAATGIVHLPAAPIEILIAASVAFAAALALRRPRIPRSRLDPNAPGADGIAPSPQLDRRWPLTFGFGLVHGFGFASVLRESGLPSDSVALPLLAFNLGVEAGQLVVVALVLVLLRMLGGGDLAERVRRAMAWAVLVAGCFWTLLRTWSLIGL
jgi:hypothetical protein